MELKVVALLKLPGCPDFTTTQLRVALKTIGVKVGQSTVRSAVTAIQCSCTPQQLEWVKTHWAQLDNQKLGLEQKLTEVLQRQGRPDFTPSAFLAALRTAGIKTGNSIARSALAITQNSCTPEQQQWLKANWGQIANLNAGLEQKLERLLQLPGCPDFKASELQAALLGIGIKIGKSIIYVAQAVTRIGCKPEHLEWLKTNWEQIAGLSIGLEQKLTLLFHQQGCPDFKPSQVQATLHAAGVIVGIATVNRAMSIARGCSLAEQEWVKDNWKKVNNWKNKLEPTLLELLNLEGCPKFKASALVNALHCAEVSASLTSVNRALALARKQKRYSAGFAPFPSLSEEVERRIKVQTMGAPTPAGYPYSVNPLPAPSPGELVERRVKVQAMGAPTPAGYPYSVNPWSAPSPSFSAEPEAEMNLSEENIQEVTHLLLRIPGSFNNQLSDDAPGMLLASKTLPLNTVITIEEPALKGRRILRRNQDSATNPQHDELHIDLILIRSKDQPSSSTGSYLTAHYLYRHGTVVTEPGGSPGDCFYNAVSEALKRYGITEFTAPGLRNSVADTFLANPGFWLERVDSAQLCIELREARKNRDNPASRVGGYPVEHDRQPFWWNESGEPDAKRVRSGDASGS